MEIYSFSDGLKLFNTKGALIKPIRLNKRMKEILLIIIKNNMENTCDMSDNQHMCFMEAMSYLEYKITGNKEYKVRISKRIGWALYCWMVDNKFHPLCDEENFDNAMQWITNKINKHYSQAEIANWDIKI